MVLNLEKSFKLIERYKIPTCKTIFCKNLDEIFLAARHINPPYVLKVCSQDILHKTDVGGVAVGIMNKEQLKAGYKKILTSIRQKKPEARIEGFLLQHQLKGLEVIIGGKIDETFGKIILFGLGGIFTEVFEDTAIRLVPISKREANNMIKEVKAYKILKGYRGKKYNLKALASLLVKTSKLLEKENIKELDFNPVIVNEREAKVVDWRIIE